MTSTFKRLTPAEWAVIVTLYQRGEKNLRELAEMHNVSKQAVSQGLRDRGIERNSRLTEVSRETDDAARVAREKRVQDAATMQSNFAQWNDILAKMTMNKVTEAHKGGNLVTANAAVLVLKNAVATLAKAREENWIILGIDELLGEGAELPDLNIGEYSETELDEIRDQNEKSFNESLDDDDADEDPDGDED